jgi:hypothetical protein
MHGMKSTYNSGSSVVVDRCQVCGSKDLKQILFIGYLPPVNLLHKIGTSPAEEPGYPAMWLFCARCKLVQLGLIVDPKILFPKEYPYTSSTTKVLRDNFAELYRECTKIITLTKNDLVVDIGSNDGNLLSNFVGHTKVLGITPEDIGKLAVARGIPTLFEYFTPGTVRKIRKKYGAAKLVTATNVFAHMEHINERCVDVCKLLTPDGVFISESHYLYALIKTVQYDTIYHEHLRYYSLESIRFLLTKHGLAVFHAKEIPSHGGSIRVYAARPGMYKIQPSVRMLLAKEKKSVTDYRALLAFKDRVVRSKLELYALLKKIKKGNKRIWGISAPSRASTLINYVGLDDGIIDCVVEVTGSYKTGNYIPGKIIPILAEEQ